MNKHQDVPVNTVPVMAQLRLAKRVQRIAPILRFLYDVTDGYTLPGRWSFLPADSDCRSAIGYEQVLLVILEDYYPSWRLTEAGVAVAKNGALVLNPLLMEGPLVFLRRHDGTIYDIVTAEGRCITGACPLFAIAHDQFTVATSGPRCLRVVGSMEEVAMLRAVGVAAAPLTSLARLNANGIRRLMRLLGVDSPGQIASVRDQFRLDLPEDVVQPDRKVPQPLQLQLVASFLDASTTAQNDQLTAVVRHLVDAGRNLRIRWEGIEVWWPTPAEQARLAFLRSLRSPELIAEFFDDHGLAQRIMDMERVDGPPLPPSPAEALEQASRELASSGPRFDDAPGQWEARRRSAGAERRSLLDKYLVLPLVNRALENPDQVEGQLQLQLAETFRLGQVCLPLVHQELEQRIQGDADVDGTIGNSDALKMFGKVTNDQIRISKELRRNQ